MSEAAALTLSNGPLRFSARALGDGPVVLCLHGFPDSLRTFDDQLPALAAAGYRAVAVTMRGYEPAAQPADGDYHAIRMVEDVAAWIDQLGGGRVHLVGHDWGATIAYAVAAKLPDRLASLVTMAVPHPGRFAAALAGDPAQLARSSYILFFQQPEADEAIARDDWRYLEDLWRSWSPGWTVPAPLLADMKRSFARGGVGAAALAWYRQAMDTVSAAGVASGALFAGPVPVPTLGICGAGDGCIAADVFEQAMREEDFPNGLSVRRVAGAGHFVHREQPDVVNAALIDWLAHHPA
ncbi:alpha/beta fold hydrolase [Glacieibacterium frigidum]|uniref:Alpha/beta hydrolase n=1 Tax=Glacieibacterium frigidum TaxID=2593303 RepID=A0A552U9S3_9SPHN|nr:alpha/beta hydrolase [Glacieibacterium frigidum]TRW14939.1 alpha/beta hydrolase [Glacieibacterium frigidum]